MTKANSSFKTTFGKRRKGKQWVNQPEKIVKKLN